MKYEVKKSFETGAGAKVTVTIRADEPIDETRYFLLRKDGAVNMAECLVSLADTMKPRSPGH